MEGSEIIARREALSWSQQRLSDELKVTSRTLQRWEAGEKIPDSMLLLLEFVLEKAEKGDKMSPTNQQIIYISKTDLLKKGLTEVIIRII